MYPFSSWGLMVVPVRLCGFTNQPVSGIGVRFGVDVGEEDAGEQRA